MLAIRLQRTGRRGHAQFRVIVQDGRLSPKSGKVVAQLGSYNPHTKTVIVDAEKAKFYLEHGAQPSPRVAGLLKSEGVKLPKWVAKPVTKKGKTKNPDKYGSEQVAPAEAKAESADQPAETSEEATSSTAEAEATDEKVSEPTAETEAAEEPKPE